MHMSMPEKGSPLLILAVFLMGFIVGDYLALISRIGQLFGGIRHPVSLTIIGIMMIKFHLKNNLNNYLEEICKFALIGFMIGSFFHHDNIETFPSPRIWLAIWFGLIPNLIFIVVPERVRSIDGFRASLSFMAIIGLFSFGYIRTWEVGSETFFQFVLSLWPFLFSYAIGSVFVSISLGTRKWFPIISKEDVSVISIGVFIGVIIGIWLNYFRWSEWGIGKPSEILVDFLLLVSLTGIVVNSMGLFAEKAENEIPKK